MARIITDDERYEWAHHPVTEEFLSRLTEAKQETMIAWTQEAFVGDNEHRTVVYNATALGGMRVLNNNIEYITGLRDHEEI
jgi:hypothetical protein